MIAKKKKNKLILRLIVIILQYLTLFIMFIY